MPARADADAVEHVVGVGGEHLALQVEALDFAPPSLDRIIAALALWLPRAVLPRDGWP